MLDWADCRLSVRASGVSAWRRCCGVWKAVSGVPDLLGAGGGVGTAFLLKRGGLLMVLDVGKTFTS